MLSGIITLLVIGLIFWLVDYFAIPDPFRTIIKVVLIIVCIVVILRMFGIQLMAQAPVAHPRIVEREELR